MGTTGTVHRRAPGCVQINALRSERRNEDREQEK
jgi:hypothetical protein